jgi:hypothetical protein
VIEQDGNVLVVYSESTYLLACTLYSVDSTGAIKWSKTFNYGRMSIPCVGKDGTIYIVSNGIWGDFSDNDNRLFALSAQNGDVKWISEPLESDKTWSGYTIWWPGSPTVDPNGMVYVSHNSNLSAFNGATGLLKYRIKNALSTSYMGAAIGVNKIYLQSGVGGKIQLSQCVPWYTVVKAHIGFENRKPVVVINCSTNLPPNNPMTGEGNKMQLYLGDRSASFELKYVKMQDAAYLWQGKIDSLRLRDLVVAFDIEVSQGSVITDTITHFAAPALNSNNTGLVRKMSFRIPPGIVNINLRQQWLDGF